MQEVWNDFHNVGITYMTRYIHRHIKFTYTLLSRRFQLEQYLFSLQRGIQTQVLLQRSVLAFRVFLRIYENYTDTPLVGTH